MAHWLGNNRNWSFTYSKYPWDVSSSPSLSGFRTSTSSHQHLVRVDNTTVVAHIKKEGGTHSWKLRELPENYWNGETKGNKSASNSGSRSTQCNSGLTVETGPSANQRVEPVRSRVQQGDKLLGYAGNRYLDHGSQPCSQEFLISSPTLGSTGSQRVQDPWSVNTRLTHSHHPTL